MGENERIRVYVATHKRIPFELPDYCEKMQVNCAVNEPWPDYLHDSDGENIAPKNPNYSELTVLYSLWKNCDADIKGLMHYRRYLGAKDVLPLYHVDIIPQKMLSQSCISAEQITSSLEEYDVILPHPEGPFPRNVFEDLLRFCYLKDVRSLMDVIEEDYPEYTVSFYEVLASEHVSYCNMMIAKAPLFDDYCSWLFDVLEKTEQRCSLEGYDAQHARLYGYLSEILLDVYLLQHRCRCKYQQMIMPTDDTSAALKLRSWMKLGRNRFHDALHLPPFNAYHKARYAANLDQMGAVDKKKKVQESSYDHMTAPDLIHACMHKLGAASLKRFSIGGPEKHAGIAAQFKESIFLHVVLADGDLQRESVMLPLLTALEDRRKKLEEKSGIPCLVRLIVPVMENEATRRSYLRKGIRLIDRRELSEMARKIQLG